MQENMLDTPRIWIDGLLDHAFSNETLTGSTDALECLKNVLPDELNS